MDRLLDNTTASGNLEIWKKYNDGSQELVFSDHNTIVSGFGASMMSLFGGMYSNDIRDYQIKYFQVGTNQVTPVDRSVVQLSAPLTSSQYDPSALANLVISSVNIRLNDISTTTQDIVEMPWHHVRRVTPTSVLYTLVLDSQAANDVTLKEAGLFVRSPFSIGGVPTPVLATYKKYPAIIKKREFSLIYKWTLYF